MLLMDKFYYDFNTLINENHLIFDHQERVGKIVHLLSRHLSFDAPTCDKYKLCASFHDVGKMKTPHHILYKPGKLTVDEYTEMKLHVNHGYDMMNEYVSIDFKPIFTNIILYHHENFDGTGYVANLKGREIPLESRLTMICDVYHALRERRSYKAALDHGEALQIMNRMKFKFDYEIFYEFMQIPEKFFDKIVG